MLAAHFAPLLRGEQVVAVSPDAGGAKRAEQFRQAMEQLTRSQMSAARIWKSIRSSGVVSGELLAGDISGKVAFIVDDLISTGGTLVRAARACRAAGATKVFAAAAHGLFIDGATRTVRHHRQSTASPSPTRSRRSAFLPTSRRNG